MQRSGPPQRRTPLKQGEKRLTTKTPLRAKTPPAPRATPMPRPRKALPATSASKRPTPSPAPRQTGPTVGTRILVDVRDGYACVRCGLVGGTNRHHREGRGMGGRGKAETIATNQPEWLLTLCGQGNTSGCHRWVDDNRAQAEAEGYVIRRNGPTVDAATVPVKTLAGWQLFTTDGTRIACPAPAAA